MNLTTKNENKGPFQRVPRWGNVISLHQFAKKLLVGAAAYAVVCSAPLWLNRHTAFSVSLSPTQSFWIVHISALPFQNFLLDKQALVYHESYIWKERISAQQSVWKKRTELGLIFRVPLPCSGLVVVTQINGLEMKVWGIAKGAFHKWDDLQCWQSTRQVCLQ